MTKVVRGIEVAEGTYYPTSVVDNFATFELRSDVEIFGGYRIGMEKRDPMSYVTILSGDIGVQGVILTTVLM